MIQAVLSRRAFIATGSAMVLNACAAPNVEVNATGGARGFQLTPGRVLRGHKAGFFDASFAPDAGRLATSSGSAGRPIWNVYDNTARIWDVSSGDLLHVIEPPAKAHAVEYSPDGRLLLMRGAEGPGAAWLYSAEDFSLVHEIAARVRTLLFHPRSALLMCHQGSDLVFLDTGTFVERSRIASVDWLHAEPKFGPDGRHVLALSDGREQERLVVWDVDSGQRVLRVAQPDLIARASISYNGEQLCTMEHAEHEWRSVIIRVRRIQSGEVSCEIVQPSGSLQFVDWTPDGETIQATHFSNESGERVGWMEFWDAKTGLKVAEERDLGVGARYSTDGAFALTIRDGQGLIWDASTRERLVTFTAPGMVSAILAPDGSGFVTLNGRERSARLWRLRRRA